MVFVGCRRKEEKEEPKKKSAMAMGPERSRSLHNFSLPCLKWGSQRQLRCVKVDGDVGGVRDHLPALDRRSPPSSSKSYHHDFAKFSRKPLGPERKRRSFYDIDSARRSPSRIHRPPPPPTDVRRRSAMNSDEVDGIEAVRRKLMLDLQTEVDRMKFSVLDEKEEIDPPPLPLSARSEFPLAATAETRPWNLRTRRAVCKEPNGNGEGCVKVPRTDERKPNFSPSMAALKSPSQRSDGSTARDYVGEKRPRAKFSVALSKQEIEEDFVAIMGMRPLRRPKKRPRCVQKQIDALFPGLLLSEITVDLYKVNENPEAGKR